MSEPYDVVILGAGPAGLAAGIYAARAGMTTLILEKLFAGGQVVNTDIIENYPGIVEPIAGFELAQRMQKQAERHGVEIQLAEVASIEETSEGVKRILTTKREPTLARAVIIATGASPRKLDIPGEERFWGKGISCCATCDGRFYEGKDVVVIGGGDAALKEGLFLTKFASRVTFVHRRDRFRGAKVLQDQVLGAGEKVDVRWNAKPVEVYGSKAVEGVKIEDTRTGEIGDISCEGVFIFVGFIPNSEFAKGYIEMDKRGYIITDEKMTTSAPGVYACGDVRKKAFRQVVTACGEGATAAFSAQHYVDTLKGTAYE